MAYKVLDEPLLLTLITEPRVLVLAESGDTQSMKDKFEEIELKEYGKIKKIKETIYNGKEVEFYEIIRDSKFNEIEDYYKEKKP